MEVLITWIQSQNENWMQMLAVLEGLSDHLKDLKAMLEQQKFYFNQLTMESNKTRTGAVLHEGPRSFTEFEAQLTSTPKSSRKRKAQEMSVTAADKEEEETSTDIHCGDCNRVFKRGSGEFTRHLKTTSCKPYKCEYRKCGKLFKKKSTLNAHKLTHSKDSFTCRFDGCNATFKCAMYLKNHLKRVHSKADADAFVVVNKKMKLEATSDENESDEDEQELNESPLDPFRLLQFLDGNASVNEE